MRSRPRQVMAYSPTGSSGSLSRAPLPDTWEKAYTLPVERATMREPANRRATRPGRCAFMAQVVGCAPELPNFMPAR